MPSSDAPKTPFNALRARLDFMLSTPPMRLRSGFLALGIVLGLSGLWMLLPELLKPEATGLPFDRNSAEAASAHRGSAVLAAEIGAIRGDLWASAAFTGARFMWTNRLTGLDRASSQQLARAKANAETALALAPVNGAAWLFLAKLPDTSPDAESRARTLLEMSYFTAPSAPELAPWRLERAATSTALADKDIQAFVKSDLRKMLDHRPEYQETIITAYRNAWPQNQPIFESLVTDVDPSMAKLLRSSQPK